MKIRSLAIATIALALVALPVHETYAKKAAASPGASPAANSDTKYPFHGKVKSVDVSGMTFTLDGLKPRTFAVTADTKIMKNGAPATLKDAVVGDDVGGRTEKSPDGKLTALSVRFGPKPGATPGSSAPAQKTEAAPANPAPTTAAATASPTPKKMKHAKKAKASPSPSPSAA
jgi:hypothetical protein